MIDINELRRLAQAATSGEWYVVRGNHIYGRKKVTDGEEEWHPLIACTDDDEVNVSFEVNAAFIAAANPAVLSELLDRLEAAEKERDALRSLVVMRFDHNHPPQFAQGYDTHELTEPVTAEHCRWFVAEIERLSAEVAHIKEVEFPRKAQAVADSWRGKCERLEAKVAEMEQQEPTHWACKVLQADASWKEEVSSEVPPSGYYCVRDVKPLYALPGAQNVPDDWLPIPEKHPTFDPVDLQLSDGSVLCGCVPQSDGDYWWKGPSGEVFIDPKYAPVTHWRLAAAPETKP